MMNEKNDVHQKLSLAYVLRPPKVKAEKSPTIFFFHGYGSNEEDLFDLARDIPDEFLVISVRAPIVLGEGQYAWFPIDWSSSAPKSKVEDAELARLAMKKFIDECGAVFPVDPARVFLLGFSQGAITSTMLALAHPLSVRGVASLSGRMFPKTKKETQPSPALEGVHFFMGHGVEDQVIPVQYAREQKECLEMLGAPLEYHEYPIAHSISGGEYQDILLWLDRNL